MHRGQDDSSVAWPLRSLPPSWLTCWFGWSKSFGHAALAAGERLMELTEDDVLEILKLFEQSKFDFLHLEQGERKITVSKGGYVPARMLGIPDAASARLPATGMAPPVVAPPAESQAPDGLLPVTAPMVGKFYAAPSPSDPPFVMP